MKIVRINPDYASELQPLIDAGFTRTPEVQQAYEECLKSIKSAKQYVLSKYFTEGDRVVIVANDYPYNLPNGYQHNVIWFLDHLTTYEIYERALDRYTDNQIALILINEYHSQSVRNLSHAHLIIKV